MEHELVNNAASTLRTLPWQLIAGGIFVVAYVFIAAEWIHKTKVALAGACLMMVLGIVTHQQAFTETEGTGVSWNTIFLLTGMMIIVNIVRRTGLFQWIAIRSAKLGRGNPFAIAALLSVVTAVLSAFLDNVTTVLLVAPVTFFVAEALGIDKANTSLAISQLKNNGWLSVKLDPKDARKRIYSLLSPEQAVKGMISDE